MADNNNHLDPNQPNALLHQRAIADFRQQVAAFRQLYPDQPLPPRLRWEARPLRPYGPPTRRRRRPRPLSELPLRHNVPLPLPGRNAPRADAVAGPGAFPLPRNNAPQPRAGHDNNNVPLPQPNDNMDITSDDNMEITSDDNMDTDINGGRKSRGRKSRGRKSRGRKSRGRKSRGEKSRGRKSRGRKSRGRKSRGRKSRGRKSRGRKSRGRK